MSPRETVSQDALIEANRTRNEFSGYQGALGGAGYRENAEDFLAQAGDGLSATPGPQGFGDIYVGCSWNVQKAKATGFLGRLLGLEKTQGIDVDLGCLYELQDGTRGALQAFGAEHGAFGAPPYMTLSHDERTGLSPGDDEYMRLNGQAWPMIKRMVIYAYIYAGAPNWLRVRPEIRIEIPGQAPVVVRPQAHLQNLNVVAVALMENVRNGIKMTNLTEYFPGQPEMDRAYGFGLEWDDGAKQPA